MLNNTHGFGIKVKSYKENEDGSVDMQVDLTEKFKGWFMYMHSLDEWDEKRFKTWMLKTLGDYIGVDPNE